MIRHLLVLTTLGTHLLMAQSSPASINEQVWKPFIKTFNEHDTEGFMNLHSKDLVRSARDGNSVINWDQYYSNGKKSAERERTSNRKRNIELRFLERIAGEDRAVEVGIYKTSYLLPDGSAQNYYGKFLVVLRKENGTWKILVDTDSSEGGTINEKSFLDAKAMDE
jgi:ketosteroid isomerase-like protein